MTDNYDYICSILEIQETINKFKKLIIQANNDVCLSSLDELYNICIEYIYSNKPYLIKISLQYSKLLIFDKINSYFNEHMLSCLQNPNTIIRMDIDKLEYIYETNRTTNVTYRTDNKFISFKKSVLEHYLIYNSINRDYGECTIKYNKYTYSFLKEFISRGCKYKYIYIEFNDNDTLFKQASELLILKQSSIGISLITSFIPKDILINTLPIINLILTIPFTIIKELVIPDLPFLNELRLNVDLNAKVNIISKINHSIDIAILSNAKVYFEVDPKELVLEIYHTGYEEYIKKYKHIITELLVSNVNASHVSQCGSNENIYFPQLKSLILETPLSFHVTAPNLNELNIAYNYCNVDILSYPKLKILYVKLFDNYPLEVLTQIEDLSVIGICEPKDIKYNAKKISCSLEIFNKIFRNRVNSNVIWNEDI